ncbi:MAG: hydantoinase B/oxoprolinase family protein [Candidatus Sumerlaeia bacterium]|nr:hydantoinase B/oxoprolinase family protein [Candidatus Sumerlaeia bacterium]
MTTESSSSWKFRIDVGGTFTDCLARDPEGRERVIKVLSTGVVKGIADGTSTGRVLVDPALQSYPREFFKGWKVRVGRGDAAIEVVRFDKPTGKLELASPLSDEVAGHRFELSCGLPAPLVAIRLAMGLRLEETVGPVEVRLGTTRATNALLERKGAPTALVINSGFGDLLRIGNQDRPRLFDLEIIKPTSLYSQVLEVSCRMDPDGATSEALDEEAVTAGLRGLQEQGVTSLAICLLHSWRNPSQEKQVEKIARAMGFDSITCSSDVSRTPRMIPRADTTVADAYLTPVIRDYTRAIREGLPGARLHLVTSAGSLVSPDLASGRDLILSGPAGGVTAVARVAQLSANPRAIGFDMGGTSTDVCRWEGQFEYEHETEKAGVRLVAPMLAIETVAAGGGSICGFDGYRLTVGPESAGADPGPACYGAGGPLTVTDMNVLLGRVIPARFPFPLDTDALQRRVDERLEEIRRANGTVYTPEELAEGYLRIANLHMAAAIRRISVAKGYDPREYALVAFGGAGAQHATAIAEALGMTRIIIHPMAGIMSAWGMESATIRRFADRGLVMDLDAGSRETLERVYNEMASELEEELSREGITGGQLAKPVRLADMRFKGQGTSITVTEPDDGDLRTAFEKLHKQLYGYTFPQRTVEVVSLRVELGERPPEANAVTDDGQANAIESKHSAMVTFGDRQLRTAVIDRTEMKFGDVVECPALVTEDTSVTVVEPGWQVRRSSRGDLELARVGASGIDTTATMNHDVADPTLLEVINSQLAGIATQMGAALRRTALSVNVKERLDYSCAIFTAKGDLVVNAPHMPVHLGSMGECVKRIIADRKHFDPGDVIVTNDPMRGGSHIPDVTVVSPVHDESGGLAFFVASRAHHAEIGGKRPGSMPPDSTNLAEEGVLIRNFAVINRDGEHFDALEELLRSGPYPSRSPAENIADIQAQIAANRRGLSELERLMDQYGTKTTAAYMVHIQEAAAAKTRDCLRRLGDGVYTFEDFHDNDARISVRIEVNDGTARIDFTGTSDVLPDNLNANRGIVTAAILYSLRCLIREDIPLNAGVLDPLEVILPRCFLNPPEHEDPEQCAAVVGGNVETSQRVVDTLLGALHAAAASQGTMNNLTFGNARFGYYETVCGGSGAGPGWNGCDAVHTHMTNTRLTDPEVFELQYPVRLIRFEIRRGSGGGGKFRGGDGARREIEFLEPVELSMLTQRRKRAPWGMDGGENGQPGRNLLKHPDADAFIEMPGAFTTPVKAGTRLVLETPGGGGWGC